MKYFTYITLLFSLLPSVLLASPYKFNFSQELIFIGFGTGMELGGLYADSRKANPTRQSIDLLNKQDVPGIDRFAAGRWDESAAQRSDILLYSTLTIPILLPIFNKSSFWDLSLLYAETLLITNGGVTLSKGLSNRYRPYAYDSNAPDDTLLKADTKRSFFSGHAAHITASSVFFAKVYSDMYIKSPYKKSVWAVSGLAILYGSWQRVEAGMHFPTDIATGMAWGALVGYWIPEWHLKQHKIQILPYNDAMSRGISFYSAIK